MKEVTKEEFFATVGQMNVHPRPERDRTYWETPNRELMGVSEPGYLADKPKKYFVPTKSIYRVELLTNGKWGVYDDVGTQLDECTSRVEAIRVKNELAL